MRKSSPKTTLPPDLWHQLGQLGIRKPFRSKRKKICHREAGTPLPDGHPVDSTAPPSAPVATTAMPAATVRKNILPRMLICNTRCLYNKVDELECVIRLNKLDIVCVTETWLNPNIPESAVSIKDFTLFRKDRGSPCGGVAAYVNCSIPCKQLHPMEMSGTITETLWLQLRPVRLPREVTSIILGIVYHPPDAKADDNQRLYDHVQNVADSYLLNHPESLTWVTGDFNPNSTKISQQVFKRACGLSQIVKVLTRDTGILDWCMTNLPKLFVDPIQLPKLGASDHFCVLVQQSDLSCKVREKQTVTKRDTRSSCLREFGQWITTFSWHEMFAATSCEEKFQVFMETINRAIEKFFPLKTCHRYSSDKPWITSNIKHWIAKRQQCLASSGNDSPQYKMWRNKVSRAIQTCKASYYKNKVKNLKSTNPSRWWREVKNLSGQSCSEGKWYTQLIRGDIDSVDTLCCRINEFSFPPLTPTDIAGVEVADIPDDLFMSAREAYVAIRSVQTRKSPGPDAIPNIVLKSFAFELAPVMADLFNVSLREGYLPSRLKSAITCPLPKQSPALAIDSDIRPISLTPQITKVMEGFVLSKVTPDVLGDLDVKQFAVAGKSTAHAIVYLLHLALEALDSGNCWIRLFFADFSKGFDLINHQILLQKLKSFNIHNSLVRWIASCLLGRTQCVRIKSVSSPYLQLNGGIPQGTRLGPLLFAIMVNDLVHNWGPRAKYVDDLTILEVIPRNSPSVLGNIVDDIQSFSHLNDMRLNPRKCKSMAIDFLQYNSYSCPPLFINGSRIECVKSFKFLGVHVSDDLTWGEHCERIVKKANRRLYALRTLKRCKVPAPDIVRVYCALLRPILEYASVVFDNLPQYLSHAIEKVQMRALAIVFPNIPYNDALYVAQLEPLYVRRSKACRQFIQQLSKENPVHRLVKCRIEQTSARYNLRAPVTDIKSANTNRFKDFVTNRHARDISFRN